jgi:hypothetical protein
MEVTNLLLCNKTEAVKKLMNMYSVNEEDRKILIDILLNGNPFNIDKIDLSNTSNKTQEILDIYLASIGLKLDR